MPSTINTLSQSQTKPLQYYIPSINQRSCKDAFSKLVNTAQNAYSHVYDMNTCESYRNNYAPMSYYEHSVNFHPIKPILQVPSENLIQYLQNQQANPSNLGPSVLENYRPDNNNGLHVGYAHEQHFLTNNPISNPTVSTSQFNFYSTILSQNSMASPNQPNASVTPQIPDSDYLEGSPEQVSVQGQTFPNPVRFTLNRYSTQQSDLQKNRLLPNITYNFVPLEKVQYPKILSQQQYQEKPMNFAEPTYKYNVPAFISPEYGEASSTIDKNPYPTNKLPNQSPRLQNGVLHKLLQAMKLTKALKTPTHDPKTNQDKAEFTRALLNDNVLANIYPTMPDDIVQRFNNLKPVPNRILNRPIQSQPAYSNITPQINPVQQFASMSSYNYQVNSLAQQKMPYSLMPNLPIGTFNPYIQKTPSESVIPITFQNPTINQPLNTVSSLSPNNFKTLPVVLPAFTLPKINQGYRNQNLPPGFSNQIALSQNQINQPTQSRINNILNQSQREVRNFTVYGKTSNLNQISGVPNLKELNNVPSKTSIIELIYLLHQKMPINYSYVKYKIPFMSLKNILQQKSAHQSGTQELHKQLALNSEVEVSPELMFGSKEQIAQLVSTNGTFMSATIVNGTDYSVQGLNTQNEGLPLQTLKILPLQHINTRKQMPKDAMNVKDLTKLLSDVQNLNSKINSGSILERQGLKTRSEVGHNTGTTTYTSTTPIEV
ncbi:uncharacterized protein LOC113228393 [Hyposmocoma kahamanoa]|uniref:uncharacterized protein LOC113228393 n=1 Tax=Hyposmocoma kahamanoa TaxID=1477025 RepID=UPI000E6D8D28|nr:uncharacterized protein LOC113228393 [Hyposmocoma kahamanoa]